MNSSNRPQHSSPKEVMAPMSPTAPALPVTTSPLTQVDARTWIATAAPGTAARIELSLPAGPAFLLDGPLGNEAATARVQAVGVRAPADSERYVLPADRASQCSGSGTCWVLPASPTSADAAWQLRCEGKIDLSIDDAGCHVVAYAPEVSLRAHRARPHADVDGGEFTIDLPGAAGLPDALAGLYWGTILPSVIERTTAANYPDPDGYVASTLTGTYLGTYPDVDHEFQIKGRLAWGSATDQQVARRMIELQLRLMREDPAQLWRDPCAVQPNGEREYHVRRSSLDGSANAVMFLVTGNVEVLESIWLYAARTKDLPWLRTHIAEMEGAASCIVDCIDPLGRLWSDVYYEDQVIKDGRETMAAALAANSLELLAQLEDVLDRHEQANTYRDLAERVTQALRAPLPAGHWDPDNHRFVDWVDRHGIAHDHLHLLANILPVLLGQADADQAKHVLDLVERELPEFQRFPTFLAARIQDYTDDEIGDGGPYDLCAAGRYWCWDAAFWSWRRDGHRLLQQLRQVAEQAKRDDYVMGERYDMDHVYYQDGSPWHGAWHYYEYPCVFAWVLFTEYLGVRASLHADLRIAPRVCRSGGVRLEQNAYRLGYRIDGESFELENLADRRRRFEVDLTGLDESFEPATIELGPGDRVRLPIAAPTGPLA